MNRAELDARIKEDEAVALVIKAWTEFAGDVGRLRWHLRKAYQMGHVDGLAVGKTSNHSPQTATTVTAIFEGISYAECPTCQANWGAMKEMLADVVVTYPGRVGLETQNHALARAILANCRTCREHFAKVA